MESSQNHARLLEKGMSRFSKRVERQKKIYLKLLNLADKDRNDPKTFRIADKKLLLMVLRNFTTALDSKKAKADLTRIYEAGIHKETGSLIINNKGATLYTLSPRTQTPYLTRHIGFCVYVPGLGIEFVNIGLVGDIYHGRVVLRSESACTPSFVYGSQRCNCAHQWESIRELAAYFNYITPPKYKSGSRFESWVQKQFHHTNGKHLPVKKGRGFILMHIDTQNGMGSGYTPGEFAFDLFSRASIRHRGEYSSEQITKTTMWGGFEAIGLTPDPRRKMRDAGYKITFTLLDYLSASRDIIFLTNNNLKMRQLKNNGYQLIRIKSLGAVNPAGAQEAEQRKTDFGHFDISGKCVSFNQEISRLKKEITQLTRGG